MRTPSLLVLLALVACQATEDMTDKSPGACAGCHIAEYKAAKNHVDVRPTTCGICHGSEAWMPSRLDHPWPLVGAHGNGKCFWCHKGNPPVFSGTTKECVGCHRAEYDSATFPDHETFSTKCEQCHSSVAWAPALFYPVPIPTITPIPTAPDAGGDANVDAGWVPKPKPKPKPKPDSGVDIITRPSGHRGREE